MPGNKSVRKWMPIYIDDYRADTMHLSIFEHGLYILLLFYLWQHPEGMTLADDFPQRVFHVEQFLWEKAWLTLAPLFVIKDGVITHKRVTSELDRFAKRKEKMQNAALSRWNANEMQTQCSQSLSQSQSQSEDPDPPIVPRGTAMERSTRFALEFAEFWDAYPRKVGKGAAERAWLKQRPVLESVISALSWQIRQPQWLTEGGKFIPHPATYLNQRRWEDSPSPSGPNLSGNSAGMLSAIERLTRKKGDG